MRKISKSTFALLLIVTMLSVALAYEVLYSLDVQNTMKLKICYGLELMDTEFTPITSYEWGGFEIGETKQMASDIGEYVYLKNVGNTRINVTWISDCPIEWLLELGNEDNPVWLSGDTHDLGVGYVAWVYIDLTEVSAVVGLDYSFALSFEIVE